LTSGRAYGTEAEIGKAITDLGSWTEAEIRNAVTDFGAWGDPPAGGQDGHVDPARLRTSGTLTPGSARSL